MADKEGPIHTAIVQWLRAVLPDAITVTVKNEINKRGKVFAIEQAKATKRGVITGWPDIQVLPFAHMTPMFFEVKAPGNYPTPTQKAVHARLEHLGYRVAVVRSIDDVRAQLAAWGVATKEMKTVSVEYRGVIS